VLDPPREGMANEHAPIVEALELLHVREAALIGCDADAWVRDVHRFVKRGWKISRIGALDLFPHTHHIEALAFFTRQN
jgi:tRNA/tmRNA/rRNA uracil-C5-methylase (TrmA/RlmC/RlmD family)